MKLRPILKDKKGDITDMLSLVVIVFFLAISFIIIIFVNTKLYDVIEDTPLNSSDAAPAILDAFSQMNDFGIQRGFMILFSFLVIIVFVSAFMVKSHPIFLFIYIITLLVTILLGIYLSNVWEQFREIPEFGTIMSDQVMIDRVMNNINKIMLAVGCLSLIILFSKIQSAPMGSGVDI